VLSLNKQLPYGSSHLSNSNNALYLKKFQYLPHPNLVSMFAFFSPINNKNWKIYSKGTFICHMWSITLAPINENRLYILFIYLLIFILYFQTYIIQVQFYESNPFPLYYGTYFILAYMPLNCWHQQMSNKI
jgi:hypothetical protein